MKKFKVFLLSLFLCCVFVRGGFADANCDPGYGYDSGTDNCVMCEAGWYSPGGSSVCQKCAGGYYSEEGGSESCSECPFGTYSPEPGDDGVNTSCIVVNCPAGYGFYGEEEGGIKCEAGWYSPGGTSVCKKCGGGRYASSAGSAGCSKCAKGTYAPAPSEDGDDVNITCRPCPNGQYMDVQGAEECKICITDRHGNVLSAPYVSPDKTKCEACPPGNCCYRYTAHICKKGTFATRDLPCRSAYTASQSVCTSTNRDGGMCYAFTMPAVGVIKSGCESCPGGRTTEGLGALSSSDCSIQSASSFSGTGGSFSWPTDGSIAETDITSSNVVFQ